MTVQKIIAIKNVGRFSSSTASGDVTFKQSTLIFAENGRGKTTLCAIFRSLQNGIPDFITGRQTLGSSEPPIVRLLLSSGPAVFKNGSWNRDHSQFAIFDSHFVTENIFAGDAVAIDQRRNLYKVIIGNRGVELARRIEQLDAKIRELGRQIRDQEPSLQAAIPKGVTVEEFLNLPIILDIDEQIQKKEQHIAALRQSEKIKRGGLLEEFPVPGPVDGLFALLSKTIESVSADAEQRIMTHMNRHRMDEGAGEWLSQGLKYASQNDCPFCDQPLEGVPLIAAYRAYFSEAYETLVTSVSDIGISYAAAYSDHQISSWKRLTESNSVGVQFWSEFESFEQPALDFDAVSAAILSYRRTAKDLIDKKISAPLSRISLTEEYKVALSELEKIRKYVGNYNATIRSVNEKIVAQKQATQGSDLLREERALNILLATKKRHGSLSDAATRYQSHLVSKASFESDKVSTRADLDSHTAEIISLYGVSINRYLASFNAGFRISSPTHSYKGGTPSSSFQIIINETAVELGDGATPLDKASFRNTLSSGDKSTLALAFFLSQLEHFAKPTTTIAVFDDPFSSQDSFRRNSTATQIKRFADKCAQIIVLSHDAHFLKLVWEKVNSASCKTLQLARASAENTVIVEWDIEKALMGRYQADLFVLSDYMTGEKKDDARDVIQKIRPVVEAYCRNLFPTHFSSSKTMGEIISVIRSTGDGHPLFAVVDEFEEINEYCRRYHHAEDPSDRGEPIDEVELQGYVARTLGLVGCVGA